MTSTLVLGGARSGKSRYAEGLGESFESRIYIATAEALDGEMAERIARHRGDRGAGWTTIEAPAALAEAVREGTREGRFVLVDCVTVWLGNLMHHGIDHEPHVGALCEAVRATKGRLVIVSNEVGQGIVPENAMARRFRDVQGIANQRLAAVVDEVVFVTAGIPAVLKRSGIG